jgi:predicted AAA+ superfamily ATPase
LIEDMFMGFRVTAFPGSPCKSLLSTERFFSFDVGVRHASAELPLQAATVRANPGPVFEQWVGIGLCKRLKYLAFGRLHYPRTKAGTKVDFIKKRVSTLTPAEVKWTDNPAFVVRRDLSPARPTRTSGMWSRIGTAAVSARLAHGPAKGRSSRCPET